MTKSLLFPIIGFALFALVALTACLDDQVEGNPCEDEALESFVYTAEIQIIIDTKCASAGCHIDNSAPGNFDSYAGLEAYLPDQIVSRSINAMDMPPPSHPPLTAEEMLALQCWIQSGYPEN